MKTMYLVVEEELYWRTSTMKLVDQDEVEDAVELASIELRRRNVGIQVYVAQRLPPLLVDPILIEQVLLNLLKNAAEAIDGAQLPLLRRHIELRVVPRYTPDEGGVIEFSVNDKGPGLKEDVLNRLYEAFFSTKVEGMGIGLSLCRSIIESHGGRVTSSVSKMSKSRILTMVLGEMRLDYT